jgi:hypothetical protein
MEIVYGLPVVAALVLALYAVRRVAKRDRLRRRRMHQSRLVREEPPMSERAEMRAYDNPTTFMDAVTTTQAGMARGKGGDTSRGSRPPRR